MAPPSTAQDKILAYGLDAILEDVHAGKFLREIARELGVSMTSMHDWIGADVERHQAYVRAREAGAAHWDIESTKVVKEAEDQFELMKAKELAIHYRWRAKAIAPRSYGDKVSAEITGADGGPVQQNLTVTFVKPGEHPVS